MLLHSHTAVLTLSRYATTEPAGQPEGGQVELLGDVLVFTRVALAQSLLPFATVLFLLLFVDFGRTPKAVAMETAAAIAAKTAPPPPCTKESFHFTQINVAAWFSFQLMRGFIGERIPGRYLRRLLAPSNLVVFRGPCNCLET